MNEKEPLIDLLIHDLTGPLSIVLASVNSLLNKEDKYGPITDLQRKTLERILRNSQKAQDFLHEMIEVYRSEEGLFRKEHCLIEQILRESLIDALGLIEPHIAEELCSTSQGNEFQDILKENGIFTEVTGRYSASPFFHDQKKVQQILRNLITNALKYRRKRMKVAIHGDMDLIISVEDDGTGIPKEKQDYIFTRFFRIKDKTHADIGGLGFGLSCVKALVETMKGEIILVSGEGTGTCLTVRIPPLE
jgi:two-component system, OmpR family, sensor kinase